MLKILFEVLAMRPLRALVLLLAASSIALAADVLPPTAPQAAPGKSPRLPPLSRPVLEVAAFRVAPVAVAGADARLKTVLTPAIGTSAERAIELRTQRNETWDDLLKRVATRLAVKLPAGATQTDKSNLPKFLPGKFVRAVALKDDALELEYVVAPEQAYALLLSHAALQVLPLAQDPRLIERMRADPAKASLFTATDAIGLPEDIALQLTEIFAGDVDFFRELHQGYRCALVYEAHYREGFIENSGRILAVELEVGKRLYSAYLATDAQGREAYFDANGKSTQRVFRRSPLEFTRITSDFTLARFHPILGVWRAHLGVDYAAPIGSKVMSVADGVVEFVGQRGGYGNLVILRHHDKFLTYYAHLNAFPPNLATGSKVARGQVVGFVGMTGLATGPHLHFEFHVRTPSGAWKAVPAPDVMDATLIAAPGFTAKVKAYRASLTVAGQGNYLFLE